MENHEITPRILYADASRLGEEVSAVLVAGADAICIDAMDGHFSRALTFGPLFCHALKPYTRRSSGEYVPIDVHLFSHSLNDLIINFQAAGANVITFPASSSGNVNATIDLIRGLGCRARLAINPVDSPELLSSTIQKLDGVVIMGAPDGYGSHGLCEGIFNIAAEVKFIARRAGVEIKIGVKGGVNDGNIERLARAGFNAFYLGSQIFGKESYIDAVGSIRKALLVSEERVSSRPCETATSRMNTGVVG